MYNKFCVLILKFFCIPIFAISSDFMRDLNKYGIFLRFEIGMDSLNSDNICFSGAALAGKYFNEFSSVYLGFHKVTGNNSSTGIFAGSEITLFSFDTYALNANVESTFDFDYDFSIVPGVEFRYHIVSNSQPMDISVSINQLFHNKDTSWAEDDSATVINESKSKSFFYPETEFSLGYNLILTQQRSLCITLNQFIRNRPLPTDHVFEMGSLAVSYNYKYSSYMQLQTMVDFGIPQHDKDLRIGFKFALATY